MKLTVIGVDPGPTTGIVELLCDDHGCGPLRIVQCNALAVMSVLQAMTADRQQQLVLVTEKFVDGRRAGRGNTPGAGRTTRELVSTITLAYSGQSGTDVILRSAAEVKPWANDERLHRVGLWQTTKGMTHARDAARHALYAAVKLGVPDPMSKYYAQAVSRGE